MICDWLAMSRQKGGTALEFYTDNKPAIILPAWADKLVVAILNRIYK